jgi:hypothetical protein
MHDLLEWRNLLINSLSCFSVVSDDCITWLIKLLFNSYNYYKHFKEYNTSYFEIFNININTIYYTLNLFLTVMSVIFIFSKPM